jgi:trehalose 6-phosphate phosphatase
MKILSTDIDMESFFSQVAKSKDRLLLLDYDGTLAPFHVERDQAFPYPGVVELLNEIRHNQLSRIVIISGRAIQDLTPLLDIDPLPEIWGSHGWEYLSDAGEYVITSPDEVTKQALSQAKEYINSLELMKYCEQKPVSLALHWRGLATDVADSIQAQVVDYWKELEKVSNLKIHSFDGGMEIRLEGKNKGTAVNSIVENLGKEVMIAYLGDDKTDEDAFKALHKRGLNVLVREKFRSTHADVWIKPPEELIDFLSKWKQSCL